MPSPEDQLDTGDTLFAKAAGIITHMRNWVTFANKDFFHLNPSFAGTDQSIVIYCIHGTADYPNAYHSLVKGLIDKLPKNILGVRLVAFEGRFEQAGIDAYVAQLLTKIKNEGHKNIILMGHSRGGLIAAKCAELLENDLQSQLKLPKIKAVIPIAAPFAGSNVARIAPFLSTSVEQMTPGSLFLKNLQELIATTSIPYYPFSAGGDELVSPESASLGTIANDNIKTAKCLAGHTHLSIMSSLALADACQAILQEVAGADTAPNVEDVNIKKITTAISDHIAQLQSRTYLHSPIPKIQILVKLKIALEKWSQQPEPAETIGAFIDSFLHDKQVTAALALGDVTPLAVLQTKLNGPNLKTQTKSSEFVLGLVTQFEGVGRTSGSQLKI